MFIIPSIVFSQVSNSGDKANVEPTMMVDKPTAGLLKRGTYSLTSIFYQNGGVLTGISVGVFDVFSFGISYGGKEIIGPNKIQMNPLPGINVKLRLLSETSFLPALALGFDSQGKGPYLDADSLKRYTTKSPGFFLVASKNYEILGNLTFHFGGNYSTERTDDTDADCFVGFEKSVGPDISLIGEYDFAFNDNARIGQNKGYLNIGVRWSFGKGIHIGFDLKDIIQNQKDVSIGNRTIIIEFLDTF
jgi:hypothetical protein